MPQRDHKFGLSVCRVMLLLCAAVAAVAWSTPTHVAIAEPGDPFDAAAAKDDLPEARRDNPRRRTRRPTIDASRLELDSVAVKKFSAILDLLAAEEWTEALELLQRLGDEHGDRLVPAGKNRYISARLHGQQLISRLPRDVLNRYRKSVDAQAAGWWEKAKTWRDEQLLLQIVRDAFSSTWGDDAAMLLAEIAFERGDIAAARGWYRSLLPPDLAIVRDIASELQYPDTTFPQPEIVAKIILCEIFSGELDRAVERISAFEKQYPDATGHLAGKHGRLSETLQSLLNEQASALRKTIDTSYSTFAANSQRQSSTSERVVVGAVQWSVDLPLVSIIAVPPPSTAPMFEPIRPPSRDLGPAAVVHPVVVNGIVYFCTDAAISAVKLRGKSGQAEPAWDAGGGFEIYRLPKELYQGTQSNRPVHGVPAYTVTVHNGRLFARLGVRGHRSFLVCLNVGRGQGKLEWELADTGIGELNDTFRFEGTPVAVDDRIFVPLRRLAPQQESYVACLSAVDGRILWRRRVAQGGPAVTVEAEEEPIQLVTVADGRVFVNTNNGVVAALSVTDGSLLWAYTYPQTETENPAEFARRRMNGPNPCVVNNGLVYAAPFDCDATLCLTAEVGSLKWASTDTRQSAYSVIGVENGCVAISGERLWLLDALTGEQRFATAHIGRERDGFGRGTIAGGCLYLPTRSDLRIFDLTRPAMMQESLLQDVDLGQENDERSIGGGNVVVAGGYVLIATPQQLMAYTDAGALRRSRGPIVVQRPNDPVARFELAIAEQHDDDLPAATESLRMALSLCRNDTQYHGELLHPTIRQTLCDVLQSRAQLAFDADDSRSGCDLLQDAVAYCDDIARGSRLRLMLAEQFYAAGKRDAAVAQLDDVLSIEAKLSGRNQFSDFADTADVATAATRNWLVDDAIEKLSDGSSPTGNAVADAGLQADTRANRLYNQWMADGDVRSDRVDKPDPSQPTAANFDATVMGRLVKKKLHIEQLIAAGETAEAVSQWQSLPRLPEFNGTRSKLASALVQAERFRDLLKLIADEYRIAAPEQKPSVLVLAAGALAENPKTVSLAAHLKSQLGYAVAPEGPAKQNDRTDSNDRGDQQPSNGTAVAAGEQQGPAIVAAADSLAGPWWRHWSVPLAEECRWMLPVTLVAAHSTNAVQPDAGSPAANYLLVNAGDLRVIEMSSGATVWSRLADRDWSWGATSGLVACVAHAEEIRGYAVLTGELLWTRSFAAASSSEMVAASNPNEIPLATSGKRNLAAPFRAVNAGGLPEQPVVEYRLVAGLIVRFSAVGVHAIALETGRIEWSYTPASGIVCNQWAALPTRLAVTVRESRELAVLDLQTAGRMVPDVSTRHGHFWLSAPAIISQRSRLAVVQPDLAVAFVDTDVPAVLNKFTVGFSRSHAEPVLFARGEYLFAINDDDTLLRLPTEPGSTSTGSVQWSVRFPRAAAAGNLVSKQVAVDDETVFIATNGFLQGFSLADGAKKFAQPLPIVNGSWRCELRVGRVWLIPDSADQPGDVLVCSRENGEPQQRLRLPLTLQRGVTAAWSNGAVVAASRRELTCWVQGQDRQRLAVR